MSAIIPPLPEQKQIVKYLNKKVSLIDTFIAKQRWQIELLNEQKQALVAHVVTRGLNSDAKFKDSGISWIGDIPEGWDVKKIQPYIREKKNKNFNNTETNVLSLSYGRIIRKRDINAGLTPQDFATYQIVDNGNIILRLTDLQNDHKSLRTGLVKERGIITSAYVCIEPKEFFTSEYLHLLLHTYDVLKVFYSMGDGLRQSMSYSDVAKLSAIIPPLPEQKQIVEYLDKKTKKINSLIENINRQIELLQEYKQRLIADVVTGKVNVQNVKID